MSRCVRRRVSAARLVSDPRIEERRCGFAAFSLRSSIRGSLTRPRAGLRPAVHTADQ